MTTKSRSAIAPELSRARIPLRLLSVFAGLLALSPAVVRGQSGSDSFQSATVIIGSSGTVTGSNVNTTSQAGEPDHAGNFAEVSLWWRWTAPASGVVIFSTAGSDFDTVLAVYEGTSFASLVLVAENDDAGDSYQSAVSFEAVEGTTYRIAVDGYDGETGFVVLSWTQVFDNDDFADAAEIGGASGLAFGDSLAASKEPGEPDHAGEPGGASLWWRWTAPADEDVSFDTFGSGFTTVLAVYAGNSFDDLIEVASDAKYDPTLPSIVVFPAVAGTAYWIAVDGVVWEPGMDPTSGTVVLRWGAALANDDFASALVIEGFSGSTTGTNFGATLEPGEPEHLDDLAGASVWWQWTAPGSGVVTFDTFGSTFDTILAVYTGPAVDDLTLVADNDDFGEDLQSLVSIHASAGVTYRIMVDGYEGETGNIMLNWNWTPVSGEPLRIEELAVLPGGAFRFVVRGPEEAIGYVERSADGESWDEWFPFELVGGEAEVIDVEVDSNQRQLYRAVVP